MRSVVERIVDRLRSARSLAWLQVIDDADLDRPVEHEPTQEQVVAPYAWLLERARDGVRLTQAGYLPPALVSEAVVTLGWDDDWIGKHNREVQTLPVLELRESAQRLGLVRKYRGQLLVTKAGRELLADPRQLWWHVAERLPDARSDAERDAGILYLLTVAAGQSRDHARLAEGMTILGWADPLTRAPVSPTSAFSAARDTWAMFRRLGLLGKRDHWDEPEPPPGAQAGTFARAALAGRAAAISPSARTPSRRVPDQAVQLFVQLRDIQPAIWRRMVVPASLTLRELHSVLQTGMSWEEYHLHLFDIAGNRYGDVEEFDGQLGDEETFTVRQAAAAGREFSYKYDFGDGWTHDIRVEQLIPCVGPGTPHLVGGARACPPEDCGGPRGYEHLLEVLADPNHDEHDDLLGWVGGSFDPEDFDLAATNANLELYDRHTRQRRMDTH